jgi:hypothetical protein
MKKSLRQGILPLANPVVRFLFTIVLFYRTITQGTCWDSAPRTLPTPQKPRVRDEVDDELLEKRSKFTAEAAK